MRADKYGGLWKQNYAKETKENNYKSKNQYSKHRKKRRKRKPKTAD